MTGYDATKPATLADVAAMLRALDSRLPPAPCHWAADPYNVRLECHAGERDGCVICGPVKEMTT